MEQGAATYGVCDEAREEEFKYLLRNPLLAFPQYSLSDEVAKWTGAYLSEQGADQPRQEAKSNLRRVEAKAASDTEV